MSQAMAIWPQRTAVCLDCRTLLRDTQEPHIPGHKVVSLRDARERDRLIERVWGPMHVEKKLHLGWSLIAVSLTAVSIVGLGALLLTGVGEWLFWLVVFGFGGVLSFFQNLFRRTEQEVEGRVMDQPLPGDDPPLRLAGSSAISGTIAGGKTALSPITRAPCVAFAVTLGASRHELGGALRDAATVGFAIITLSGDTIEIPAGRIELVSHSAPLQGARQATTTYLDGVDPVRRSDDDRDPFAHSAVAEVVLQRGDHVALHNPIRHKAFATANTERGYRDAPRQVFTIEGTPCLELLP